ncbi:MAG: hypothetical protein V2J62_00170 [candidate division KSB1 bacterium]|jgi:hypothetical protein|nr:hypothetical protein [candidate division KSB1 bacterium]
MFLVTSEDIRTLAGKHESPCISIYIPTHRKGSEVEQDPIRLKNMIKEAGRILTEKGFKEREIIEFMNPAVELLGETHFWNYQSDGLTIFLSPEYHKFYRLPISFDERTVIGDRFHIKPLIPLLSDNVQFYALSLNLNDVKLYRGSGYQLDEIESGDILDSIEEVLKFDDPEKQLQFHTGTGARQGKRAAMFHGQGVGGNDKVKKKNILRFFQAVDKGVRSELGSENYPLILAGLDHLNSLYREANSYPHLLDRSVDINPADLPEKELHKKVWAEIEPYFQKDQDDAISQYHQLAKGNKASDNVREIVKAAHHDRIKYLFVDLKKEIYGQYSADRDEVEIHEKNQGEDLTNVATMETILRNGKVYALESEEMPADSPMAAVFRF